MGIARTSPTRDVQSWQNGVAMGGLAGIASFQPSLLPRSRSDQAITSGGSIAMGFLAGWGVDRLTHAITDRTGADPLRTRLTIAGGATGVFAAASLLGHGNMSPRLSAVRTAAIVVGTAALTGIGLMAEHEAADAIAPHIPGGKVAAHLALISGAAAIGTYGLLFRPRRSALALGADPGILQGQAPLAATFNESHHASLEALRSSVTSVSGGADSALPIELLDKNGVRFLKEVSPGARIAEVMGTTGESVKDPIRVYGGLKHAATPTELADKVYNEAVRLGAFDRKTIALWVPSGSGHINPVPLQSAEYLAGGDIASIGLQYNNKPSLLSIGKVPRGRDVFDATLTRFADHIRQMPEADRPRLVAYGESLGAWASQEAFVGRGPNGLADRGIDAALWAGTPRMSKWKPEVLSRGGYGLDATGQVFEFNEPAKLAALSDVERSKVRAFLLTHYNDPVGRFEPSLFYRRPEWLADKNFALGIPRRERFIPGVLGLQSAIDTKNGTKVIPGVFVATGHDYRADLAPVVSKAFNLPATDEQIARLTDDLMQSELARKFVPVAMPEARQAPKIVERIVEARGQRGLAQLG